MKGTVMVLVNGEVLANEAGSTIAAQRANAEALAEDLVPIMTAENKIVIMHGNKPQVGFVLFRSELASHVLHTIPLDVCGADTQGATGYMLSLAFTNALARHQRNRKVICVLTQTLVDTHMSPSSLPGRAIGPWYDRNKAEQYRQTRGWQIIEDPGRGYRRSVPTYAVKDILEIEGIKSLVELGYIVITGGGGGIPVARSESSEYSGIEAVVETEEMACLMAQKLDAKIMLSIIETDEKFILSGLSTEGFTHISRERLAEILANQTFRSRTVQRIMHAAAKFLGDGGDQVVITTQRGLKETLGAKGGLRIGSLQPSIEMFRV